MLAKWEEAIAALNDHTKPRHSCSKGYSGFAIQDQVFFFFQTSIGVDQPDTDTNSLQDSELQIGCVEKQSAWGHAFILSGSSVMITSS